MTFETKFYQTELPSTCGTMYKLYKIKTCSIVHYVSLHINHLLLLQHRLHRHHLPNTLKVKNDISEIKIRYEYR